MIQDLANAIFYWFIVLTMLWGLLIPIAGLFALLSFLAVPIRRRGTPTPRQTREGRAAIPNSRTASHTRANPPMRVLRGGLAEQGMAGKSASHLSGDR